MVEVDKAQFALCTLQPGKIPQQPLDYCFTEGEEITFFTEGPGDVHLTGYLVDEPNAVEFEESDEEVSAGSEKSASNSDSAEDDDESSSEEVTLGDLFQSGDLISSDDDDEDEESADLDWDPSKDNPKRRKPSKKRKKKKQAENLDENNIISLMDVEQTEVTLSNYSMHGENEGSNGGQKNTKSEIELRKKEGNKKKRKVVETENQTVENGLKPAKKLKKKGKKSQLNSPNSDGKTEKSKTQENSSEQTSLGSNLLTKNSDTQVKQVTQIKRGKETQPSPGKQSGQPQTTLQAKRKTLPGGTVFEDIKKGTGPMAKRGQIVHVYYKGTLAKNKKQFDACLSGQPFSFRVGAGQAIQGWDQGVTGMQVGGKRRLIVPPSQGYGHEKIGPIPPNSTLEFEVQLVKLQ